MTPTQTLILAIVVFRLFDGFVEWLHLRSLNSPLPDSVRDVYEPDRYQKSQLYTRERVRLGLFHSGLETVVMILAIALGFFESWNLWVVNWGFGSILNGLLFIGGLGGLQWILSLPFSLYTQFHIEEKYGFNRMTLRTFLVDTLKGVILVILIGAPVLSALLWLLERIPSTGWLWAWLGLTLLQIFLVYIAPITVLPLFNKFQKLPEGPLRSALEDLAQKNGFLIQDIFTMDGSRRSTKANAFFTGFGRFRRIVLFDTLLQKLSVPETVAVMAHEIGHFRLGHIRQQFVLSIVFTGILLGILNFLIREPWVSQAFGMQTHSLYTGVFFAGILFAPIQSGLALITLGLSRRNEFQADGFAKKVVGSENDLIAALKTLSRDSLSHLTPHPLKVVLDYSHPPLTERIRHLLNGP